MSKQLKKMRWVWLVSLMVSILVSQVVQAQDYPTKPVILIVPAGPGGTHDLTARAVNSVVSTYLGQPLIVELKPGGGGAIGTEFVSRAAPDGYTLLFGGPGWNSTLPAIEGRSKGPDQFEPVCMINYSSSFTLVRSESPYKTFKEMIQWAKANPGKLIFGNTGVWGGGDLTWKQIKHQAGIVTRDVSHDGGGPMLTALLGGHIDVGIVGPPVSLPHVQAGKLRALTFNDSKRFPQMPNVPTAKEEGVDVVDMMWRGVLAPKGTPRPIVTKLAAAFKKVTEDPSFIEMVKKFGDGANYLGPEEFSKFWREEYEARKELAKIYKK